MIASDPIDKEAYLAACKAAFGAVDPDEQIPITFAIGLPALWNRALAHARAQSEELARLVREYAAVLKSRDEGRAQSEDVLEALYKFDNELRACGAWKEME